MLNTGDFQQYFPSKDLIHPIETYWNKHFKKRKNKLPGWYAISWYFTKLQASEISHKRFSQKIPLPTKCPISQWRLHKVVFEKHGEATSTAVTENQGYCLEKHSNETHGIAVACLVFLGYVYVFVCVSWNIYIYHYLDISYYIHISYCICII